MEDERFTFQYDEFKNFTNTRRGLLSMVSSLYDPLGFVSPVILVGRKCLQDLCNSSIGWDDPLPDESSKKLLEWQTQLPELQNFSIERCLKPAELEDVTTRQLHCFADGSSYAYGCVVYLRQTDSRERVHTSFLIAKSRVAPLKPMTVPRMELTAATVAVRVGVMMERELEFPVSVTFWTDSMKVLRYANNSSRKFKVFVANRISEIHDKSSPHQWRYVNTKETPADIASRGCTVHELMTSRRGTRVFV